jgi:hypothetical protein
MTFHLPQSTQMSFTLPIRRTFVVVKKTDFRIMFENMLELVEYGAYEYSQQGMDARFIDGYKQANRLILRRMIEKGANPVSGYGRLMYKTVEKETMTVAKAQELDII